MIASKAVIGWSERIFPGRITAPVTKTGKEEETTVTVTSFETRCAEYSLRTSFSNSAGVIPTTDISPTGDKAILPSLLICWVVSRLRAPGMAIFTTSPSRKLSLGQRDTNQSHHLFPVMQNSLASRGLSTCAKHRYVRC